MAAEGPKQLTRHISQSTAAQIFEENNSVWVGEIRQFTLEDQMAGSTMLSADASASLAFTMRSNVCCLRVWNAGVTTMNCKPAGKSCAKDLQPNSNQFPAAAWGAIKPAPIKMKP